MKLDPKEIAKYGAVGILTLWLTWTNVRLSIVETQLVKCLEGVQISDKTPEKEQPPELIAILQSEMKIKTKKR